MKNDNTNFPLIELPYSKTGICGAYVISVKETGMMYVGSAKNLYNRIHHHGWLLSKGKHYAKGMQLSFDSGQQFEIKIYITETRKEAYDIEHAKVKEYLSTDKLFNVRSNVGTTVGETERLSAWRRLTDEDKELLRKKSGDKMSATKRSMSRKVSINGNVYSCTNTAAEALGLDYNTVSNRVRSNTEKFMDWFFVD